jgi:ribosomal protein S18 acetylase RimI-like enzyme
VGWPPFSRRSGVTVRQVTATDLAALGDFFAGLSTRTRLLRFFAPITPTGAMLRRLAGATGGAGRMDVLVAVRDGVIIGHAMAVQARCGDRTEPGGVEPGGEVTADIGVVVADGWQGRGVGSALMRALVASVQARGVTSISMDVRHDNRRVLAMIAGHWPGARSTRSADCLTVRVELPPGGDETVPGPRSRARATACLAGAAEAGRWG